MSPHQDPTLTPQSATGRPVADAGAEVLVIGTAQGERLLRFETGAITLGRGLENDVVLSTRFTSRVHARIVRSAGRFFFLEDCSRNGTYVSLRESPPILLRYGQQLPLVGYGLIGLGVLPEINAPGTLRFSLVRSVL